MDNQTQQQPTSLTTQPPIQSTPPPPSPAPQPQEEKKFDQIKALGWVLALVAIVFFLLVAAAITSNFINLKGTKTPKPTLNPTPQPLISPAPSPTPELPESRFNIP